MNLPDDLKDYKPQAFFDMDDNEMAWVAAWAIVFLFFMNWVI